MRDPQKNTPPRLPQSVWTIISARDRELAIHYKIQRLIRTGY